MGLRALAALSPFLTLNKLEIGFASILIGSSSTHSIDVYITLNNEMNGYEIFKNFLVNLSHA